MRLARLLPALLLAASGSAGAAQITVSAAASLTDAFKEIAAGFEKAHPGTTLRLNFAASGVLLLQIEQGAPVDVLATADQATMDRAAQAGRIDATTRRDFATNSLVLVEPAQGGLGLTRIEDLAQAKVERIAIGKTRTVPAGRYTQQVLERAGVWESLQPKFVQADSVRQALDYVSRGEVEAGFVYRTDATLMADKVKIAATAENADVLYPAAVVAESENKTEAAAFLDFLEHEGARKILARYGFGQP